MAVYQRAVFVLAALALPVSSQWLKTETFVDSNCSNTTGKQVDFNQVPDTCSPASVGTYYKRACVDGVLQTSIFNDSACSTTVSTSSHPTTCQHEDGEHTIRTCVDSLPTGWAKLDVLLYDGPKCTGNETKMAVAAMVDTCNSHSSGSSEKVVVSGGGLTASRYTTGDCSGEANITTYACGTCTKDNNKVCPGNSGVSSHAGTVATLSKAASVAVALIGIVALSA